MSTSLSDLLKELDSVLRMPIITLPKFPPWDQSDPSDPPLPEPEPSAPIGSGPVGCKGRLTCKTVLTADGTRMGWSHGPGCPAGGSSASGGSGSGSASATGGTGGNDSPRAITRSDIVASGGIGGAGGATLLVINPPAVDQHTLARALFLSDPRVIEFVHRVTDVGRQVVGTGTPCTDAYVRAWERNEGGWAAEARERAEQVFKVVARNGEVMGRLGAA